MTACAVKGCDRPATWIAARDTAERRTCKRHADQAAAAGYTIRRAPAETMPELEIAEQAAAKRARAEADYRAAILDARAAGASLGAISAVTGLSRSGVDHITRLLPRTPPENGGDAPTSDPKPTTASDPKE